MNAEFLENDIEVYMSTSTQKVYIAPFSRKNLSAESFMGARIHIVYAEVPGGALVENNDGYATIISVTEAGHNRPTILYAVLPVGTVVALGYANDQIALFMWSNLQFTVVDSKEEVDPVEDAGGN